MISVEMTVLLFFIFLFSSCPFLCLPLCLKTFFALRFITSEQGDGSHIEVITTCFFSIRKNSLTVYFRLAFFKLYHTDECQLDLVVVLQGAEYTLILKIFEGCFYGKFALVCQYNTGPRMCVHLNIMTVSDKKPLLHNQQVLIHSNDSLHSNKI